MWVGQLPGKSSASGTDRSTTLPDFTKPSNAVSAEVSVAMDWAHPSNSVEHRPTGAPERPIGTVAGYSATFGGFRGEAQRHSSASATPGLPAPIASLG